MDIFTGSWTSLSASFTRTFLQRQNSPGTCAHVVTAVGVSLAASLASDWASVLRDLLMLNLVVAGLKQSRMLYSSTSTGKPAHKQCSSTLSVVNMMPCSPCWTQGSIRSSIRLTSDPRFLILGTKTFQLISDSNSTKKSDKVGIFSFYYLCC